MRTCRMNTSRRSCRVMLAADWHTYQILTKRAGPDGRIVCKGKLGSAAKAGHLWWGECGESQTWVATHREAAEREAERGLSLG